MVSVENKRKIAGQCNASKCCSTSFDYHDLLGECKTEECSINAPDFDAILFHSNVINNSLIDRDDSSSIYLSVLMCFLRQPSMTQFCK